MSPDPVEEFHKRLSVQPVVAILRGITPAEVVDVAKALVNHDFRLIEVPLNSPDALRSIELLAENFTDQALVGAGTVLSTDDVSAVEKAGGRLIVSPNTNEDVIRATRNKGLLSVPGFATPSEGFTAVNAGAHALKLFPAEGCPPNVLKAMMAVLPPQVPVLAVGGISDRNMSAYHLAGAQGFGIGSALYKPGRSASDVAAAAEKFATATATLS